MPEEPSQNLPPDVSVRILDILSEIHDSVRVLLVVESTRGAGVRESVVRLVHDRPGFFTSSQIADQLSSRIHTKSDDPRRVVMTTIAALVREGVLQKDALDRLLPVEVEEVAHTEHSPAQ